ncbi:Ras-related protein R-Ras2-like [Oopsacas minuta]|uniref:Ras-related protein R-Ras2-like n=1 Tax=Oopsacas minuta TaxID=111878 RepID=A0AAV7JSI3_9METZ|nr:Ras-related protein R-Ras2-like [Oopsacas minuta]
MNQKEFTEYKLVVVGSGAVGKSALTLQFVQSEFIEDYDPTIEDTFRRQCAIDEQVVMLDILDTAGQDEFSAMREQFFQYGEGFLLVYSIIDRQSFQEIEKLNYHINRVKNKDNLPKILYGNKGDLAGQRVVSTLEGDALAAKLGTKYLEGSAKHNVNVDRAFHEVVRLIRSYRDNEKTEKKHKPHRKWKCEIL